mmetsp:Transcript_36070/g.60795  ORF Transcript_36070/g.60795 Transcript_36070/m.60795 type:complete len:203 (+) Transcript_36070:698-1306(+)
MTQSVPSSTALATSVASARVGRGFMVMDSSICVAVITGLPFTLQRSIMRFCTMNIFSIGISIPRSPRATIMPSDSSKMSSKLSRPSLFSTLEMILMFLPASPITLRMCTTSDPLRTKDGAMKSTLFLTPHWIRSSSSLGVIVGRSTTTPGKFMFFFSPSLALFSHLHCTVPALTSQLNTISVMLPSAARMRHPGSTSSASLG